MIIVDEYGVISNPPLHLLRSMISALKWMQLKGIPHALDIEYKTSTYIQLIAELEQQVWELEHKDNG